MSNFEVPASCRCASHVDQGSYWQLAKMISGANNLLNLSLTSTPVAEITQQWFDTSALRKAKCLYSLLFANQSSNREQVQVNSRKEGWSCILRIPLGHLLRAPASLTNEILHIWRFGCSLFVSFISQLWYPSLWKSTCPGSRNHEYGHEHNGQHGRHGDQHYNWKCCFSDYIDGGHEYGWVLQNFYAMELVHNRCVFHRPLMAHYIQRNVRWLLHRRDPPRHVIRIPPPLSKRIWPLYNPAIPTGTAPPDYTSHHPEQSRLKWFR